MLTTFPSLDDLHLVNRMLAEWTARHYPLIPYKRLLTDEATETDDVHDEIPLNEKRFSSVIQLRSFAAPAIEVHPLTRFGLEHQRDVVLQVGVPDLVKVHLAEQDINTWEVVLSAGIGDWFQFSEGVWYEVMNVKRLRMFGNTDIPLVFEFTAERAREEAETFAGV